MIGRSLKKMIDRVKVQCQCGKEMKYSEIRAHAETCCKMTMVCPIEGCSEVLIGIADMDGLPEAHLNSCEYAII